MSKAAIAIIGAGAAAAAVYFAARPQSGKRGTPRGTSQPGDVTVTPGHTYVVLAAYAPDHPHAGDMCEWLRRDVGETFRICTVIPPTHGQPRVSFSFERAPNMPTVSAARLAAEAKSMSQLDVLEVRDVTTGQIWRGAL